MNAVLQFLFFEGTIDTCFDQIGIGMRHTIETGFLPVDQILKVEK